MTERKSCVICKNDNFEHINQFDKFPIMAISNDSVKEEYYNLHYIACTNCNCLQLKHLVDPNVLYSEHYMNATFSPIWTKHNLFFSNFILENNNDTKLLEIGSNKGELYNILSQKGVFDYTTLDMYKHKDLPNDIKFIQGNCENFNYNGFNTIILSHVFEHLYNPTEFIENLKKCCVKNIFITIPNYDSLLEEKSNILIYSQHTFYCGYKYMMYMFSLYNYTCEKYIMYDTPPKSTMFKFVLSENTILQSVPDTNIDLYKYIFFEKINNIKNMSIPANTYIAPSGIYGQYIYYFIQNKKNIIGFIDNNKDRHNKKLYGTDKLVYSSSNIDPLSNIIICECPYKEEIELGLKFMYPLIKFLYI
jgi:2-polyprenyl-3-methyl-5-hydroxy-6-metoxy-1,4-benzoquinol methylase